jgi:beta-RFAP synthase
MTTVRTGSRLHFGLLTTAASPRAFGGIGVLLAEPAVRVRVMLADTWSVTGPHAERARRVAEPVAAGHALALEVLECPPEHIGLGVGTQLSLAVAQATVLACTGQAESAPTLAARVGRGLRSGIGVHGFAHGGWLVDGGKGPTTQVAPLLARLAGPSDWRWVLLWPEGPRWCGAAEQQAFAAPPMLPSTHTAELARLVWQELLPAVAEADVRSAGAALTAYNRLSGELFRAVQGGVYASPAIAQTIAELLAAGAAGAGQSSWGPTVFALVADADQARWLAARYPDAAVAAVANCGWQSE